MKGTKYPNYIVDILVLELTVCLFNNLFYNFLLN